MPLEPAFLQNVAQRLIDGASERDICLRLFGGIGIRIRCPNMRENGFDYTPLKADIDFAAPSKQINHVNKFLCDSGFVALERPNYYAKGEHHRYRFYPKSRASNFIDIDVYFGQLRFNHVLPLPYFDKCNKYTLPITQLLLSKLAILEISENDALGICAILAEHDIGNAPGAEIIQEPLLEKAWCKGCSGWCIAKTCHENIRNINRLLIEKTNPSETVKKAVVARLDKLEQIIIHCRKSICWRARDAIGLSIFGVKVPRYYDVRPPEY